jgi:putative alpha-1,2-mannosidase
MVGPSNAKKFTIAANNLSDQNSYVQSVELNGKKIDNPFLPYSAVGDGGNSHFHDGTAAKPVGTNPRIPK